MADLGVGVLGVAVLGTDVLGRDIAAWRSRFAVKGHGKAPSMRGPRVTVRG
jgi:hypothetical protein